MDTLLRQRGNTVGFWRNVLDVALQDGADSAASWLQGWETPADVDAIAALEVSGALGVRRVVDELLRLRLQARDLANNPPAAAENAGHRQRQQGLLDVAGREQQRMGSEVHDGLGQELTGAALMLQACLRDLRTSNSSQSSAHHLLRIAQEAMNNSLKHSSATVVVLELGPTADGIYLCVRDNGRGFPDAIAGGDGLGMRLTQYRAHQLGAELRTHSAPNQGVTITCRCPVHSLQLQTDFPGSRDVR